MDKKVALLHCKEYNFEKIYSSINQALEIIGGIKVDNKTVLLKPNILLGSAPENVVTTHPVFLEAVIRIFQERGARVIVGDSPAIKATKAAAKKCGILTACEKTGVELVDFSKSIELENPSGRLVKRFKIAAAVQKADLIVSLPKLKTHTMMYYTGAMKNLFGVIPGLNKARFHLRFPDKEHFAAMLTDLNLLLQPELAIMDGIIAMEGHGPKAGDPREVGALLVSKNILALDWVAAGLIGYDPMNIPLLKDALERKHWLENPEDIQVCGSPVDELRVDDFKRIKILSDTGFIKDILPDRLYHFIKNMFIPRPVFNHDICIRCGDCVRICPAEALKLEEKKKGQQITIDYKKCIRCYCCHEVCPVNAIDLKKRPF